MPREFLEDGRCFQLIHFYSLEDDAWSIELVELAESVRGLMYVLIPDEDMERPCEVVVEGPIPPGVLKRAVEEATNLARFVGADFGPSSSTTPEDEGRQGALD